MNYALWVRAGSPETCQLCLKKQREKKVEIHLRKERKLPCKKHGDPKNVLPELQIVCQLYSILRPYHEIRYDKDGNPMYFLNLALLHTFCAELGVNFIQVFERIEILHKYLDGAENT